MLLDTDSCPYCRMASTSLLRPRPAASLELGALEHLCSGNLDVFLADLPHPSGAAQLQTGLATGGADVSTPTPAQPLDSAAPKPTVDVHRQARLRTAKSLVRSSWQYKVTGSARAAAVLASHRARWLPAGGPRGIAAAATALIAERSLEDTTYIYDMGNVTRLFRAWRAALPRVTPFYAVKCNPDPALLRLLATLGAGLCVHCGGCGSGARIVIGVLLLKALVGAH